MTVDARLSRDGSVVLRAEGVTKVYRSRGRDRQPFTANDALDLVVRRGEVVALLGPNGAGKTTFLKQVAGQLLPTQGHVEVGGVDMIADPRRAKERLSVIPQECEPVSSLTVEEHVRYFGRIKSAEPRTADRQTEELLDLVGLRAERGKLTRELSGGQKRRVLLALALTGGASLLLLDEPTTGLDPEGRRSVWTIVDRLKSEGRGVLLTTHYIEEAEVLADRVVIIVAGRFVATGTVEEIRGRLPFQGRLDVLRVDRLRATAREALTRLEARWRVSIRQENRWRFEVPDPFSTETVHELERLALLGVPATLAPATLEDAYLQITGEELVNGG